MAAQSNGASLVFNRKESVFLGQSPTDGCFKVKENVRLAVVDGEANKFGDRSNGDAVRFCLQECGKNEKDCEKHCVETAHLTVSIAKQRRGR